MAALFPKIYDIVDGNPFRDSTLNLRPSDKAIRREQSAETWDCFIQSPLNPPGSLSQFLINTDPLYGAGSPALRKQILTEKLLEIQQRVDAELVGRKWSRKKIHDAFGEQINSSTPPYSDLLEEVLCELYTYQKIILHRKSKSISFFPTDLRLWKSGVPIYVGDDEGCWAYQPTKPKDLLAWITEKEDDGWKCKWPTAEGKLEDIKANVLRRNLTARPLPGSEAGTKVKKEDWARTLGRVEAIETLANLRLTLE
jgi:hypothetical protein